MTSPAERIRERHRGWRRAQPASESRLSALETFGLRYVRIDDFNVLVEGRYQLNLALSFWREVDGDRQGYLVSALDAEIKKHRNPAGGRDSVATESKSFFVVAVAEPPAGLISAAEPPEESTAALLPAVWP